MSEIKLDNRDKVSIFAMEYGSLRSDINARMSSMIQLFTVFVTVAALVFHQLFWDHVFQFIYVIVFVFVVFSCGLVLLWRDIRKAGKRVQWLEAEINRRAKEKLLVWETELGGISGTYWWWQKPNEK